MPIATRVVLFQDAEIQQENLQCLRHRQLFLDSRVGLQNLHHGRAGGGCEACSGRGQIQRGPQRVQRLQLGLLREGFHARSEEIRAEG